MWGNTRKSLSRHTTINTRQLNLLITICARGGSKGIPGKNIRPINGKPLIAYSIDVATQFARIHNADLTLSTDDEAIRQTAGQFGLATSYNRPESLATDNAGKQETILDVLQYEEQTRNKQYDFILDLDVTSPLRNLDDLTAAFGILNNDTDALNLFSVNPAGRNPYFNMVEQQENGYYGLVKKGNFVTRQSAPKVYELNASFYFYRRAFYNTPSPKTITDRSLVYIMPHICFDLDHPVDFDFMEYLMINDKLGFHL
jgi:CMP-N,N'-diacetyllegionaminic acid synthase